MGRKGNDGKKDKGVELTYREIGLIGRGVAERQKEVRV